MSTTFESAGANLTRTLPSASRWCGAGFMSLGIAFCLVGISKADSPTSPGSGTPQEPSELQEVVVTARYRQEDLQQTPLAITALSGDQIQARGYSNVMDAAQSAPNVSIMPATVENGKSAQAFIRGIGQIDVSAGFSPGVGFEIDGVYFDSVFGSQLELMDLDHIEIMRGPQGTLFGKNTDGGAVRLFSVKPKGDGTGYLEASMGSFRRHEVRGAFDVSVIPDEAFLRVSAAARSVDGYMQVLDYACLNPTTAGSLRATTHSGGCGTDELGGSTTNDVRASLRLLPMTGLEINLIGHYLDDHGESPPNKTLTLVDDPAAGIGAQLDGLNHGPNGVIATYGIPLDSRFVTRSPYTTYQGFCSYVSGICTPNRSNVKESGVTGIIDWDLGSVTHLKSTTAYEAYDGEFATVVSGAPIPQQGLDNLQSHNQFSQELDLTSTTTVAGRDLDLAGGLYFLNSRTTLGGLVDIPVVFSFTQNDPATSKDESAFLHAIYKLSDAWSLEAGYRFTHEKRTFGYDHVMVYPTPGIPVFVHPPRAFVYNRNDWKVGLSYQVDPRTMLYSSVATGFKGGGINPRPILPDQITTFDPETVIAYELGFKSTVLGEALRLNGAVFQNNYKNLQTYLQGADAQGLPLSTVANSDARIRGAELELRAMPAEHLTINATLGYLDFRYTNLRTLMLAVPAVPESATTVNVPKWKGTIGPQYRVDLAGAGSLTGRVDWVYQSRVFFDVQNSPLSAQSGYGVWNAGLTWASHDDLWQVQAQGFNLANKIYYANMKNQYSSFGVVDAVPGMPREYRVTLRRNF